ncbi:MAG: cytochrome P450 [Proteobacteria bacterium]|nr:cytochrome P450 [Pseudomonadota bacterium]
MSTRAARARAACDELLLDEEFLADPYPVYAAWREDGPLHWSEAFFGGAWVLTRHADVDAMLRDTTRFSARRTGGWVMQTADVRQEFQDFQQLFARAMLFLDAPDHGRIRGVLNAGFRADLLQRWIPTIERRVDAILDAVDAASGFDFVEVLARPLPAEVMALLMGIPAADSATFIGWSDELSAFIGSPSPSLAQARRARHSLLGMARYFEGLAAMPQRIDPEGLMGRLLQAEAEGGIHCGAELLSQCAMLLFAGHETTRNLLGNGLRALLAEPGAWQRLRREPALLPGAVREVLRFDSPVQYTGRRAAAEMVVHGQRIARGDLVIALIGSANRDPARYEQPDRLDIGRRGCGLLSFGAGPHVCIGAALSLMEAEIVFGRLLERFPRLAAAEGPARWNGNPVYRGLSTLLVKQGAQVAQRATESCM